MLQWSQNCQLSRISMYLKNEMTDWPLVRLLIRSCQMLHPLVNASCPQMKVKRPAGHIFSVVINANIRAIIQWDILNDCNVYKFT